MFVSACARAQCDTAEVGLTLSARVGVLERVPEAAVAIHRVASDEQFEQ